MCAFIYQNHVGHKASFVKNQLFLECGRLSAHSIATYPPAGPSPFAQRQSWDGASQQAGNWRNTVRSHCFFHSTAAVRGCRWRWQKVRKEAAWVPRLPPAEQHCRESQDTLGGRSTDPAQCEVTEISRRIYPHHTIQSLFIWRVYKYMYKNLLLIVISQW